MSEYQGTLIIFMSISLIMLICLYRSIFKICIGLTSHTITGVITETDIETYWRSNIRYGPEQKIYYPTVKYTYTINQQKFMGFRYSLYDLEFDEKEDAKKAASSIILGETEIHVSRMNPAYSYVVRGPREDLITTLIFVLAFIGSSLLFVVSWL